MKFKNWLSFQETATGTSDVAGFQFPLFQNPEKLKKNKKKKKTQDNEE